MTEEEFFKNMLKFMIRHGKENQWILDKISNGDTDISIFNVIFYNKEECTGNFHNALNLYSVRASAPSIQYGLDNEYIAFHVGNGLTGRTHMIPYKFTKHFTETYGDQILKVLLL